MSNKIPIHALAVLLALMRHANTRWRCHPGVRKLAETANINKDTVVVYAQWLVDARIVLRSGGERSGFRYQIQPCSLWRLSDQTGQIYNVKLSDTTAQISVRRHRTAKKSILRVNCPTPSDLSKDTLSRMSSGQARKKAVVGNAPLPTSGHALHSTP